MKILDMKLSNKVPGQSVGGEPKRDNLPPRNRPRSAGSALGRYIDDDPSSGPRPADLPLTCRKGGYLPPNPRSGMKMLVIGAIFILILSYLVTFLSATHFNMISKYKTSTVENEESELSKTIVEDKKAEVPMDIMEVKIIANIVENKESGISMNNMENKEVEISGIHIFSWIQSLEFDLSILAMLANSTLSSSRSPDDVFFHFFVPPEEDEKLSYYKLKAIIRESNLEIISQKIAMKKLTLPNLEDDSMQAFLSEAVPFLVPKLHLSLSKYVFLSPNIILEGQIEDIFYTDLGPHAIGTTENCEKRLGDFVNMKVLNAIQRIAVKSWIPHEPYDKNACIPDFNLILVDPRKLEDTLAEAIVWWTNALDLEITRRDHIRLAMTLALHNKYLELPSTWKLEIDETEARQIIKPPSSFVQSTNKASNEGNNEVEIPMENKDVEILGIHIFSWIHCLEFDLSMLIVLINSTLSASRSPDDVFFHFFIPLEEDEKLSYGELKAAIPKSNLEIISQKSAVKKLKLPILEDYSMQAFINEVAPLLVPKSHLSLSKYVYVSSNIILKEQVDDIFDTDLGPHAIGATESCEKKLGDLVNVEVLNGIQRIGAKSWVSDKPYDKNACIPDFNLILVDPKKLDDNMAEAILWWTNALDLEITRGEHIRVAMALTLHNKYMELPSSWKLKISEEVETVAQESSKGPTILALLIFVLEVFWLFHEAPKEGPLTGRATIGLLLIFILEVWWLYFTKAGSFMGITIGLLALLLMVWIIYTNELWYTETTQWLMNRYLIIFNLLFGLFLILYFCWSLFLWVRGKAGY